MKVWDLDDRSTEWLLKQKRHLETLPIELGFEGMAEYWLQILMELKRRIKK